MACQSLPGPRDAEPARLRYQPADPRLDWQMVREHPAEAARDAAGVRFRILPPLQIQGTDLLLAGELENNTDAPAVVHLFGVDWQPLTLRVRYTDGLAWQPPCADPACAPQPPVPPPAFRITLPAHTVVEFTGRHDLRTLAYAGNPTAEFIWRFDYAGTRAAESGTLAIPLPPR